MEESDPRQDSSIGPWQEWARVLVTGYSKLVEELKEVRQEAERLEERVRKLEKLPVEDLMKLPVKHAELKTAFRIKSGIYAAVPIVVFILYEIAKKFIAPK